MQQPGWVHASCPAAVIQAVSARGVDGRALARDAGIELAPGDLSARRVPLASHLRFYHAARAATADPDLGLAVGHVAFLMGMNLHLYMTSICTDLRQYLNVIPSTIRLRGDLGRVLVAADGDRIRLEWRPQIAGKPDWRCLDDEMLYSSAAIVKTICARPVPILGADLCYPRPASCAALERAFGSELHFDRSVSCLYLPRESLAYPLIDPGFALGSEFSAAPRSLFAGDDQCEPFLRDLRWRLRRSLPGGDTGIDQLAADLGLSRRTLQRRLAAYSLSFSGLLQGLREELAQQYLENPHLAITEIALLLGYSDQASFSTAFRSWRGCSPREYRSQRQGLAP